MNSSDPRPQRVLLEARGGLAVAAVTGALDIHTAPNLTERATNVLTDHPHLVFKPTGPRAATALTSRYATA
ncbi:hypothetical protein ACWGIU_23850 [Streptomyces sp. NPDC054840]